MEVIRNLSVVAFAWVLLFTSGCGESSSEQVPTSAPSSKSDLEAAVAEIVPSGWTLKAVKPDRIKGSKSDGEELYEFRAVVSPVDPQFIETFKLEGVSVLKPSLTPEDTIDIFGKVEIEYYEDSVNAQAWLERSEMELMRDELGEGSFGPKSSFAQSVVDGSPEYQELLQQAKYRIIEEARLGELQKIAAQQAANDLAASMAQEIRVNAKLKTRQEQAELYAKAKPLFDCLTRPGGFFYKRNKNTRFNWFDKVLVDEENSYFVASGWNLDAMPFEKVTAYGYYFIDSYNVGYLALRSSDANDFAYFGKIQDGWILSNPRRYKSNTYTIPANDSRVEALQQRVDISHASESLGTGDYQVKVLTGEDVANELLGKEFYTSISMDGRWRGEFKGAYGRMNDGDPSTSTESNEPGKLELRIAKPEVVSRLYFVTTPSNQRRGFDTKKTQIRINGSAWLPIPDQSRGGMYVVTLPDNTLLSDITVETMQSFGFCEIKFEK